MFSYLFKPPGIYYSIAILIILVFVAYWKRAWLLKEFKLWHLKEISLWIFTFGRTTRNQSKTSRKTRLIIGDGSEIKDTKIRNIVAGDRVDRTLRKSPDRASSEVIIGKESIIENSEIDGIVGGNNIKGDSKDG